MQYVKLKDALSAVIDKSLDSICFYPASAQHRQPAEGALFMVRLVPMHVRFVPFSVEVLFPSAARFRRFGKRGRAVPSAVAFGAALSVGAVRAGVRRARASLTDQRTVP